MRHSPFEGLPFGRPAGQSGHGVFVIGKCHIYRFGHRIDQLRILIGHCNQDWIRIARTFHWRFLGNVTGTNRCRVWQNVGSNFFQARPAGSVIGRHCRPVNPAWRCFEFAGWARYSGRECRINLTRNHALPRSAITGKINLCYIIPGQASEGENGFHTNIKSVRTNHISHTFAFKVGIGFDIRIFGSTNLQIGIRGC